MDPAPEQQAGQVDSQPVEAPAPLESPTKSLHRLAWEGDVSGLKALLAQPETSSEINTRDCHGNTALHLAALRGDQQTAEVLVEAGAKVVQDNSQGWTAIHDAAQEGHAELARYLAKSAYAQLKCKAKEQRSALLTQLAKLPDFTMQLKWELSSSVPGLGLMVRHYAPHDTYTIWKQGSSMRVDGSLMGVKDHEDMSGGGLLPEWDRGHFSLIYTSKDGVTSVRYVNHTEKQWTDLKAVHKRMGTEEQSTFRSQAEELLNEASRSHGMIQAQKMKSRDFRFDPVKGWLGKPMTEDMDGWKCKVYDASVSMVKVKRFKLPFPLSPSVTWQEYVAASFPPDITLQIPTNPLTSAVYSAGKQEAKDAVASYQAAALKEAKRIMARRKRQEALLGGSARQTPQNTQTQGVKDAHAKDDSPAPKSPRISSHSVPPNTHADTPTTHTDTHTDACQSSDTQTQPTASAGVCGSNSSVVVRQSSSAEDTTSPPATPPRALSPQLPTEPSPIVSPWRPPPGPPPPATSMQPSEPPPANPQANTHTAQATTHVAAETCKETEKSHSVVGEVTQDVCEGDGVCESEVGPCMERCGSGESGTETVAYGDGVSSVCGSPPAAAAVAGDAAAALPVASPAVAASVGENASDGGSGGGCGAMCGLGRRAPAGDTHAAVHTQAHGDAQNTVDAAAHDCNNVAVVDPESVTVVEQPESVTVVDPESVISPQAQQCEKGANEEGEESGGPSEGLPPLPTFKPAKKLTGRCWMAEDFPLSLHDLLPLLEAIGTANKYVAKVAKFMSAYGDRGEFPVKVVLPLLFTLNIHLTFKNFKFLPPAMPPATPPATECNGHAASTSADTPANKSEPGAAAAPAPAPAPVKRRFWSTFTRSSQTDKATAASAAAAAAPATATAAAPSSSAAAAAATAAAKDRASPGGSTRVGGMFRRLSGSGSAADKPAAAAAGAAAAAVAAPRSKRHVSAAPLAADFFDIPADYTQEQIDEASFNLM